MEKGKCGHIGYISGWFEVLTGAPRVTDADLGCRDTDWVGANCKDVLDAMFWQDGLILGTLSMDNGKCGYLGYNSC